jgi:hypothetical protein
MDEDRRLTLALEESMRALESQSEALDDLRSRTGILLTALALTASFLGARALDDSGFDFLNWVALIFFAIAGVVCLLILLPWGDWRLTHDANKVLEEFVDKDEPLDVMRREMAETNQTNWGMNKTKLRRLQWLFRGAVLLLVLQVGFWLASLGTGHAPTQETEKTVEKTTGIARSAARAEIGEKSGEGQTGRK